VVKLLRKTLKSYLFGKNSAAAGTLKHIVSSLIIEAEGPETILITSSVGSEGKTAIALNMAARFAESGRKILLVEGNLENPTLTNVLNLRSEVGLPELVLNGQNLSEGISRVGELAIDVIGGGSVVDADSVRVFSSDTLKHLLEEAKSIYDVVLLDASGVAVSRNFLHLADIIDRVILVVAPGIVTESQLRQTRAQLGSIWESKINILLNRYKEPIPYFLYKLIWKAD
jgi:capsular exopolysaccharide synthesis family protein